MEIPWFVKNITVESFAETLYHWDFDIKTYKKSSEFLKKVRTNLYCTTPFILLELSEDEPKKFDSRLKSWKKGIELITETRELTSCPILVTDTTGYGLAREDAISNGATDVIKMRGENYMTPLNFAEKIHKFYEYVRA